MLAELIAVADKDREKLLAEQRHLRIVSVVLKGTDGPLVGKALRLTTPTIAFRIAVEWLVDGDGRQGHGCPKLGWVEQVMADEGVGHLLCEDAIPHASKIVVNEFIETLAGAITVKARMTRRIPQTLNKPLSNLLRPLPPELLAAIAEFARDLRQRGTPLEAVGHYIHRSEWHHHLLARGRRELVVVLLDPVAPKVRRHLRVRQPFAHGWKVKWPARRRVACEQP